MGKGYTYNKEKKGGDGVKLSDLVRSARINGGFSYDALAEHLNVSACDIVRWESGESMPCGEDERKTAAFLAEYAGVGGSMKMDVHSLHGWESYAAGFEFEYRQLLEEGKDVERYAGLFEGVSKLEAGETKTRICEALNEMIQTIPMRKGYEYFEPSDLVSIRETLPEGWMEKRNAPEGNILERKIRGAWLGRICGCLLGKTVEGIRTNELHDLLKKSGNWPMQRYILSGDITKDMVNRYTYPIAGRCFADRIPCAPSDDDTNYMCLAYVLVERYGRDFTSLDVSNTWLQYQPRNAYCTAERAAYVNFLKGFRPPVSAVWQNPYREWIGAQIRGDYFGYINPGNPSKAAEMAWRDASVSHVKNGIYGEMFISAMIAEAAVEEDILKIIRAGLKQIPPSSRLYRSVENALDAYINGVSCEDAFKSIYERYDEKNGHDWCHVISNALIVVLSLLFGNGDFGKSICMAVQAGFDTDCNGATVGSILGMLYGDGTIEEKWTKPLNGMLDTEIIGLGRVDIEDMVQNTISHIG